MLVAPGTYYENLDFLDKGIDLRSEGGSALTVIDGQRRANVVMIISLSGAASSVVGFTLRNGYADPNVPYVNRGGGGVLAWFGSVAIADNIIEDNWAMQGAGVYIENAQATVERNHIRNNLRPGNFGGSSGTGVHVTGIQATARIANNIIEGNRIQGQADGGAISLFHTAHPIVVESNIIRNNSGATLGGGFAMYSQTEGRVRFANNLVTGNSALRGGGLYLSMVQAGAGIDLINNTLADNVASEMGSEVATFGFAESVFAANNIISGSGIAPAVWCDSTYSPLSPVFTFNVMFGALGAPALGNCSQAPYLPSNQNADPRFGGVRDRNRYAPGPGSPAIDRGDNVWSSGLATDVSGRPRRVDGNHDGKAVVDIGALEVQVQRQ